MSKAELLSFGEKFLILGIYFDFTSAGARRTSSPNRVQISGLEAVKTSPETTTCRCQHKYEGEIKELSDISFVYNFITTRGNVNINVYLNYLLSSNLS